MKELKKLLSGVLIVCLLVAAMPLAELKAVETDITAVTVTSLTCYPVETIEKTGGYTSRDYDSSTGQYMEYYRYSVNPKFDVTFSDGTTYTNRSYNVTHNGQYYYLSVSDNQSYGNQWGVGTQTLTATLGGVQAQFEFTILECPIESIIFKEISVVEGTNGAFNQEYDSETGEYNEYYRYQFSPRYTVKFKDGTEQSNESGNIVYNGQQYWLSTSDDQSYSNQWGIGTHTVNASIMGYETTFEVTIIKSPIVSIVAKPITIIEGTNGYYTSGMNSEGENVRYFQYQINDDKYDITFEDGTVLTNQDSWFTYNGMSYSVNVTTDQSADNPWKRGKHTATAKVAGVETEFSITILASPIIDAEVMDTQMVEGTNSFNGKVRISFEDGTVQVVEDNYFYYGGEQYEMTFVNDQCCETPWGVGTHSALLLVGGLEVSFNYEIVESAYSTIEIINVGKIYESDFYTKSWDGSYIYSIPDFALKVIKEDGTSFIDYYVSNHAIVDEETYYFYYANSQRPIYATSDQYNNPWTVGGNNTFSVTYAGLTTSATVELLSDANDDRENVWEYYEDSDGIYITGCETDSKVLEIPSEMNGKPVVGVLSLGEAAEEIHELVIPDSVIVLGEHFLKTDLLYSEIEKISIGANVSYLSAEMFNCDYSYLTEIIVSEENEYYCSVDNVVYDKNMETIIAYPIGRGYEYTVPASVTNIDVMFDGLNRFVELSFEDGSKAFVEEDGIIYSADKTIVVSCNIATEGEVALADTVKVIGAEAFDQCGKLTGVTLPNSVTDIAYGAFNGCTSLKNIMMSDNLTHIGEYAFSGCSALETVELPNSLTAIERKAFYSSKIKYLTIPDSVTAIEDYAFGFSEIQTITLGSGVTSIGAFAFERSGIKTVEIPDNVTSLGDYAFYECSELEQVTLGKGISYIGEETFVGCSQLKNVTLKNENVVLGNKVFMDTSLESINLENITAFGKCAFDGTKLSSVVVQDGVTEITYGTFTNCSELSQIDIPESVVKINSNSLNGTAWLADQDAGVVYLEHVLYSYKGVAPENTKVKTAEGVTVIAENAFEYQEGITSIELAEGVKVIGDGAFFYCKGLEEITIPASVTEIGAFAFGECDNLTAIYVSEDNEYYKSVDGVLYNKEGTELIWCPKQETDIFVVPYDVSLIRTGAFGCSGVKTVQVENIHTELQYGAIGYNAISVNKDKQLEKYQVTVKCYENALAYEYAVQHMLETELKEVLVEAIEVATLPVKTEYELGDTIDTTGLTLNVEYSNETSGVVSEGFEVFGFDSMQIGTQTITVSLGGQTATFDITMTGAQIIGENARGAVGDTIQVPIRLQDNKGVNYLSIKVAYDSSALELVSAEDQGLLEASFQSSQYTTDNPYTMIWAGLAKNDADGDLVILTFKILDTAQEGEYPLQITYTEAYDLDYNDVYFAVTSPVIAVKNYIAGDTDDDGEINGKDVTMLLRYLAGWNVEMNEDAADVNADGEVNGKDVTLLLKYLAEWDVTLG